MSFLRKHWRGLTLILFLVAAAAYAQNQVQPNQPFGNLTPVAGTDGTLSRILATDATGHLILSSSVASTPADPCLSPYVAKLSISFAITTATTTQLVAPSGAKVLYPCGFVVSMTGTTTADTIQFTTGTGATCTTTGNQLITGVMSSGILTQGATVIPYPYSMQPSVAGGGLCAVTTIATGPTIAGTFTYVFI